MANTWEVQRWRYVISYLRSLPIFFLSDSILATSASTPPRTSPTSGSQQRYFHHFRIQQKYFFSWMKRNCVWKIIWCYCWRSTAIFSAMSLFDPPFSHFQKGGVWKSADIRNPGDLKTEIEEIQTQSKRVQFCWLSKEPGLQNVKQ